MDTPARLRDRLLELGIDRNLRTLTDWRQKGLLPPLQRASSGRGRGVKWSWSEDTLDQAIAVNWILDRSGRADEALVGLWLSGYSVDLVAAQRAWLQHVKRVRHRRQKEASRYGSSYLGLGRSLWRKVRSQQAFDAPWWRERSDSDREVFGDFIRDTLEWLHDDAERDDDAYRYQIAEVIIRLIEADRRSVYRALDRIWAAIDPASIFAVTPSIEFIESLSPQELGATHESLGCIARMLQHALELGGPTDQVSRVIVRIGLMGNLLGPPLAKLLIEADRKIPGIPLRQAILSLHHFVMSVQSTDITNKNDCAIKWEATKRELRQVWSPISDWIGNAPATPHGPQDRDSG